MCDPGFDKLTFALDILKLVRETTSKLSDIEERVNKGYDEGLCTTEYLAAIGLNLQVQKILNALRDSSLAVVESRVGAEEYMKLVESYNEDLRLEEERRTRRNDD